MLDIGGLELLVIVVVALVVIGPKELPGAIRTASMWMRKTRELARDFQSGLEDLSREAGVDDLKRDVEQAVDKDQIEEAARDMRHEIENTIDDPEARKILEDPDTKKLLAEIESGEYFGSPPETLPPAGTETAATALPEPEPVPGHVDVPAGRDWLVPPASTPKAS